LRGFSLGFCFPSATTGRKPGNLSRTLKTMSNYGIVEMRRGEKQARPIANYPYITFIIRTLKL
jgi:predicted transcriptional regulator